MAITALDFTNSSDPYLFCGKTGQIAHVPSSHGIAQSIIFARHTAEATCRLRMVPKHCAQLPYLWFT